MLGLKNPFTKSDPPTDAPVPSDPLSVDAAEKAKKRWQLEQGRTKARVDALAAELDSARTILAHATQAHGEVLYDQKDSTAEASAMRRASDHVTALEAALAVAVSKDGEALDALTDAQRQAADAADGAIVAAFKASALKMQTLLCGEMKLAADELGAALMAVKDRSEGDGAVASSLRDFLAWFSVYRDRACAALIPSGRTYSQVLDEKKKTFSAWADDVAYAVAYRRKGR